MLNLFKSDLFPIFLVVEGYKKVVIVYDHTVNKAINPLTVMERLTEWQFGVNLLACILTIVWRWALT